MDDQFDKKIYEIRQKLAEVVRSRICWQIACVAFLLLWIGYFLDRNFEPSAEVRQYALVTVAILCVGWFLFRLLPTLWFQPSNQQIVGLMARAKPASADLIFSAEQSSEEGSAEVLAAMQDDQTEIMHTLTRQQANEEMSTTDFTNLFKRPSHGRWARVTIVTGLAAFVSCLAFPSEASFYLRRLTLSNDSWPRLVRLIPEGFKYDEAEAIWVKHFARRTAVDLNLTAELSGNVEAPSSISVKSSKLFGRKPPENMLRVGQVEQSKHKEGGSLRTQQYLLRLDDLSTDTELKLRGGDDHIRVRLVATDQPIIISASLKIVPPSYLNLADREKNPSMLGNLPEGSSCLVTLCPSKRLSSVNALWISSNNKEPIELLADYEFEKIQVEISQLMQSGVLSITYADEHGIEGGQAYEIPIDIQKDSPPKASAKMATYGRLITKEARLPITARIDDDHALKRSYMKLVNDSQLGASENDSVNTTRIVELPKSDFLPVEIQKEIDLSSLFKEGSALQEGDQLRVRVGAEDLYDLQSRTASQSEPIFLQVVSSEELLATLGDRERELRKRLEATLSDARRLAYSIARGSKSTESSANRSEWHVETEKIVRDLNGLIAQIQSIHDEAINNRLDRASLTDRLESAVLDPLKSLISGDLEFLLSRFKSQLAENPQDIGQDERETSNTEIAQFVDSAENVVRVLTLVIEAMQMNESYNEIVASLRAILRDQKQLNQLTERERREEAKRILLEGGFDDF